MLKQLTVGSFGKVAMGLITVGVMTASAANYRVSIHQDANVDGKQVKAGDYKIAVEGNTAVLKRGKESIEVPVKSEQASSKFSSTQIQYADNNTVQEIRIGGTNTKLVFGGSNGSAAGL
jgi:hypothetical protein